MSQVTWTEFMADPPRAWRATGQLTRDAEAVVLAAVPFTGVALDVSTARTSISQVVPSVAVVTVAEVAVAGATSVHPPSAGHDAEDALCRV